MYLNSACDCSEPCSNSSEDRLAESVTNSLEQGKLMYMLIFRAQ